MAGNELKIIRKAIEIRDFVGWSGLPSTCDPHDVFDDFPTDLSDRAERPLGDTFEPATFVVLDMGGYYRPTASIRDGSLVLFDGMTPELAGGTQRLLDALGPATARLDWYFGTLEVKGGEWVYPERGMTLFMNSTGDKALHIALYKSTDLKTYANTLRPHLRKEPRQSGLDDI